MPGVEDESFAKLGDSGACLSGGEMTCGLLLNDTFRVRYDDLAALTALGFGAATSGSAAAAGGTVATGAGWASAAASGEDGAILGAIRASEEEGGAAGSASEEEARTGSRRETTDTARRSSSMLRSIAEEDGSAGSAGENDEMKLSISDSSSTLPDECRAIVAGIDGSSDTATASRESEATAGSGVG